MRHENTHQPVILLIDKNPSADNRFIKRWFEKSRFSTCEAADIFHAFEKISDFTMPQRPDVILLEVSSICDDFQAAKKMSETLAGAIEPKFFAFAESGKVVNDSECFEGNLAQIEARLNKMIPVYSEIHRTLAA